MIVDLQGVGNILTDPQIHCLDLNKFGKGNRGYLGMLMFFNTHRCNEHCRALNLKDPRVPTTVSLESAINFIKVIQSSSDVK
jgi:hypothetical protein